MKSVTQCAMRAAATRFGSAISLVLLLSLLGTSQGRASGLGPPTFDGYFNTSLVSSSAGVATGGPNGELSLSMYYAGGTGYATAAETAYAPTNGFDVESESASVFSEFEVVGPSNSMVPVVFNVGATTATTSAGQTANAEALAYIGTSFGAQNIFWVEASSCAGGAVCVYPTSLNQDYSFTVTANTIYYVTLTAGGSSNLGTFSASVDPSINFSSSFNSSGYSLAFSSDASPAPPVPLPGSAWLLLSALGTMGIAFRRAAC
jgi:hypothetical protein